MSKPQTNDVWLSHFVRLSGANICSNLMVPLAGLVDTAFLGHLADIRHLAGVSLATVIFNVIYWSFGFLRMGTTGLTAQAAGRQDRPEVWRVGLRGMMLALGFGSLILLLQTPLRLLAFAILQGDADVLQAGQDFYRGRIWGAPAVLMNYVLLGWFLGQGQGRQVILLSLVGNGGNVLLDAWFIRGLGWASYGAGLATALSQMALLLVGLAMVLPTVPWQQVRSLKLWDGAVVGDLFRLNRDILIRTFALVMCFAAFTQLSAQLGTTTLAVNTLLLGIVTLAAYFLDGIAFSTETYAGQFYGQHQMGQLRSLVWLGSGLSLLLSLGFAAAFILFPRPLFSLLTNHDSVLSQVPAYTVWLIPVLGFGAIAFMLDGYFLGLTAGRTLRNSTIVASSLGFAPVAAFAYWVGNPHLLWLAMTSFMAMRAITLGRVVPRTLTKPVVLK